jgi:hypothetical protein
VAVTIPAFLMNIIQLIQGIGTVGFNQMLAQGSNFMHDVQQEFILEGPQRISSIV